MNGGIEYASDPIVVSGVGACTPVGHSAAASYTSVRAGLARISESCEMRIRNTRGKLATVNCAAVAGVTDGLRRYLRQFNLAVRALAETLSHARLTDATLEDTALRIAVFEPKRPGCDERLQNELVPHLCRELDLYELPSRASVSNTGHAGALLALREAVDIVASGRHARVIVGAVDSFLDEMTLQWLADTGRLKSPDNAKGFVPGEASAFLVVERASAAQAREGRALARVTGVGTSTEKNGWYEKTPCTGEGLTLAVRAALDMAAASGDVSSVLCDLNGERFRANEWGLALARCFGDPAPTRALWHPAEYLGDCGAAAGAMNLVFASLALARGNMAPGQAMVWGSSDDGERGAAVLARLACPDSQQEH